MPQFRKTIVVGCLSLFFAVALSAGGDDERSRQPFDWGDGVADAAATPYDLARNLILVGEWEQAGELLEGALARDPGDRGLHRLYAEVHYTYFKDRGWLESLDAVATHAMRAVELGLAGGELDMRSIDLMADAAPAIGDLPRLERLFTDAEPLDGSGFVELAHAHALARLGSSRAEGEFRRAGALEAYAEWLLDQGRPVDVVSVLAPSDATASNLYLHFLRGVALERQGLAAEAAAEYEQYRDFSELYPAPGRFAIAGSAIQRDSGIQFRVGREVAADFSGTPVTTVTTTQATKGLSYLLYGEAQGESPGGQRAEGWVVRNRVLRGSVYLSDGRSCPYVINSGSTVADRYKSVMCQGNGAQFNGVCLAWCSNPDTTTCKTRADITQVASDVFFGFAPDPVGGHCPSGFATAFAGNFCDKAVRCKGNMNTFRLAGGVSNRGTLSTCPAICTTLKGKTCGNGSLENCFYFNPRYARVASTDYSGSVASGQSYISASFTARAGTQKGHLEGPEIATNPDLDLYLEQSCGTNCWRVVMNSIRVAAVEDVTYTSSASGVFRWRVRSFSGAGAFKLYTVRP